MDPGSAAHRAARHSASKTRVNALMPLRSIRGTLPVKKKARLSEPSKLTQLTKKDQAVLL
jgi:hypothetical protein